MNAYGQPYSGAGNYTINGTSSTLTDYSFKKVSFNAGTHLTLAAGYMFDKHVGIELAGQFNISAGRYTYNANGHLSGGYAANSSYTDNAKLPVMIIPGLVLQTGEEGFNLYTRLGIVLPVNTKIEEEVRTDYIAGGPNGINNKEYALEESSKFTVGYTGALGLSYKTGKIKIWAELNAMSLSVELKEQKVTAFANDGHPVPLQYVTPGTIEYMQSGTYGKNAEPTYSVPFSYIGGMAGIGFKI